MPDSTTCPRCRHPLRWVLTLAGKRLACDPTPRDDGHIVIVQVGHALRGHVLSGAEMPWLGATGPAVGPFVEHARTCGKTGKAPARAKCRYCTKPLHPLITAGGGTRHWLCGPDPKPADLFRPARPAAAEPVQIELPEAS
jgi:hypothetical protein